MRIASRIDVIPEGSGNCDTPHYLWRPIGRRQLIQLFHLRDADCQNWKGEMSNPELIAYRARHVAMTKLLLEIDDVLLNSLTFRELKLILVADPETAYFDRTGNQQRYEKTMRGLRDILNKK